MNAYAKWNSNHPMDSYLGSASQETFGFYHIDTMAESYKLWSR